MKKFVKIASLIAVFLLALCCFFAIPRQKATAYAAGSVKIELSSSLSQIKTNAAGQEFTVTVTVKNTTGGALYNAQAGINFDTNFFEFVQYVPSTDIKDPYQDVSNSNAAGGKIVIVGDNEPDAAGITAAQWKIGSVKLKVKSGVTLSGNTSITLSDVEVSDINYDIITPDLSGGSNVGISFVPPSTACEVTSLKISNKAVTASGTTYSANVDYTVDKLSIAATFSAGATSNISTLSNKSLAEGLNTFTFTVTAEDKTTAKAYTVNVTRANGDTTNTLSSLTFKKSTQALISKAEADLGTSGTFAVADKIEYADRDKLSVEFAKKSNLSTAVATLKQSNAVVKNNFTGSLGTLNAGAYSLEIKVTPQKAGAAANTYTVTFEIVAADADDKLSSLSMSIINGTDETPINFAENFAPETFNYSATVPKNTTKVKLTGTYGALAKVTGLGEIDVTLPCSLKVVVTSQSSSSNTYTVFLAPEKDLGGLTLNNLSVVGYINGETERPLEWEAIVEDYLYKVYVPSTLDITSVKIKADEISDEQYSVQGINIKVPMTDGKGLTQYVQFVKNKIVEKSIEFDFVIQSNIKTLEKLTVNGVEIDIDGSDPYNQYKLYYEVGTDVKSVNIAALSTDPHATVNIYCPRTETLTSDRQNVELTDGTTVVVIRVKATDDSEGVYTLRIKRPIEQSAGTAEKSDAMPYIIALSVTGVVALILIVVLSTVIISMRKTEKDG